MIPRTVRLSEAPSFGKTIFAYDPLNPGATAYRPPRRRSVDRAASVAMIAVRQIPPRLPRRAAEQPRLPLELRGPELFSIFHLAVVFILWGAVFAGKPEIGGFGFAQTLTYFVVLFVLQFFIGAFNEDYQISEDIRNGLINQFLLKPINYFLYRLSMFAAARLVSGALGSSSPRARLPLPPALPRHPARGLAAGPGIPGDGAGRR